MRRSRTRHNQQQESSEGHTVAVLRGEDSAGATRCSAQRQDRPTGRTPPYGRRLTLLRGMVFDPLFLTLSGSREARGRRRETVGW